LPDLAEKYSVPFTLDQGGGLESPLPGVMSFTRMGWAARHKLPPRHATASIPRRADSVLIKENFVIAMVCKGFLNKQKR
jgi:hypothetical protein